MANAPVDERLAASGILMVVIDVHLVRETPYPGSAAHVNHGVRWLKSKAREWNVDPSTLGTLGSSRGGHVLELCAMRPHDPRYTLYPPPDAPQLDATLTYGIARSPISNPLARYKQAQRVKRDTLIQNSEFYCKPWDSIIERNPQLNLGRARRLRAR